MSAALVRSLRAAESSLADALGAVVDMRIRAQRDSDSAAGRRFLCHATATAIANAELGAQQLEAMHIAEAPTAELALDDRRATHDAVAEGR